MTGSRRALMICREEGLYESPGLSLIFVVVFSCSEIRKILVHTIALSVIFSR